MTPQQILAKHLQNCSEVRNDSAKEGEKNNLSAFHKLEREPQAKYERKE